MTPTRTWCIAAAAAWTVACMLCGAGCTTPKESIQKSATYASAQASAASESLVSAEKTGEVGPKALPFVHEAQTHIGNVVQAAASISEVLPGVVNVEPWYSVWAKRIALYGIVGVGLYFLWPFAPAILAWLIVRFPKMLAVVPRTIRAAAKFDAESLTEVGEDSSVHRAVTVRRASSPIYDAAFVVAKSRLVVGERPA